MTSEITISTDDFHHHTVEFRGTEHSETALPHSHSVSERHVSEQHRVRRRYGIPFDSLDQAETSLASGAEGSGKTGDLLGDALLRLAEIFPATPHPDDVLQRPLDESDDRDSESHSVDHDAERRAYPRREADLPVSAARESLAGKNGCAAPEHVLQAHGLMGELLDLSRNGLALAWMEPLEPGERIVTRLCHPQSACHHDQSATVVRVSHITTGLWKVVAQFDAPLEFDFAYELFQHCTVLR